MNMIVWYSAEKDAFTTLSADQVAAAGLLEPDAQIIGGVTADTVEECFAKADGIIERYKVKE